MWWDDSSVAQEIIGHVVTYHKKTPKRSQSSHFGIPEAGSTKTISRKVGHRNKQKPKRGKRKNTHTHSCRSPLQVNEKSQSSPVGPLIHYDATCWLSLCASWNLTCSPSTTCLKNTALGNLQHGRQQRGLGRGGMHTARPYWDPDGGTAKDRSGVGLVKRGRSSSMYFPVSCWQQRLSARDLEM